MSARSEKSCIARFMLVGNCLILAKLAHLFLVNFCFSLILGNACLIYGREIPNY